MVDKYIITPPEIPKNQRDDFLNFIRGRCCPMEGYWRRDWDEYLLKRVYKKTVTAADIQDLTPKRDFLLNGVKSPK